MKTLFVFILALFVANTAFADLGPVARSSILKYDGTVDANSLEQHFIKVLNKSGGSVVAGKVMIWDVSNDDGASVTTTTSASQMPACIMAQACSANALCLCQTYGYNSAVYFHVGGGNAVAGAPFFISTGTAGYIKAISSPGAGDRPAGIFYDAASASGTVEAFIRLR